MPNQIIQILVRLRQDRSEILSPDSICLACRQAGYRWRNRRLDPVATVSLFLLQVLNGNTACRQVVHFGDQLFSASAYCQARIRWPLILLQVLVEQVANRLRRATSASADWLGHRVRVEGGSSFSMADVDALRDHFGQPSGQRPGCGFPMSKWVALCDLDTGMRLRVSLNPMRTHELFKAGEVEAEIRRGDVVLGDRGFCSYAHIAMLNARGFFSLFCLHQKQLVDFTPGRAMATKSSVGANPAGLPHSRWVRSNGTNDQIVIWFKPKQKPRWMKQETYDALPEEVTVRELRYRVSQVGFRVKVVTVVTTLLDPAVYAASELAGLYRKRWQVELNFRHIKITMKMDVLRSKTVEGITKKLLMFALAYNLIRSVMVESAKVQDQPVDRIGFLDAMRWLLGTQTAVGLGEILVIPSRPDRVEPRVRKRRPKQYKRMNKPRSVLRNRQMGKEVAA